MKNRTLVLAILFSTFIFQIKAQSVVGLWEVTSVKVGDRTMTPVAKWFRNNADLTFQSGNGWTQNSYGIWSYNSESDEFRPTNENGIKDEFGPFKVNYSDNGMTWARVEEGMDVIVSLIPIDEIPMGPADKIHGLWQLSGVNKGNSDIFSSIDPNQKQFIFIRPDRRFRLRNPDEQIEQGFWHMDGHRPLLTLINYNREIENNVFSVEFENDQLFMKKQDGDDITFIYNRIKTFPE